MRLDRRTRTEVFSTEVAIAASHHHVDVSVVPHVHDFIELALVTAGSAQHRTAGGSRRLGPGDLVVVRPGGWHAYDLDPEVGPFEVTNAYLGPELLHAELAWLLDYPALARLLLLGGQLPTRLPLDRRLRVAGWLAQLAAERTHPDVAMKAGLLGCVLIEVSRVMPDPAGERESPISDAVRQSMRAMSGDLAHPWTVDEAAALAGVSASTLYRQFRTQLGTGPVQWLTGVRAERAATLLTKTDLPVAAIGRRVGWPDPSYASRRFAQVYAMSPTAYRAAHSDPP
jgi:AraC-like DNA-binding protein/mannose-6-phosphate isomerase-like protein (cupin superfamily)